MNQFLEKQLPSKFEVEAEICRRGLHEFVKRSWPVLFPNTKFVDGWHIQMVCEYLEATTKPKHGVNLLQNLIINIPFRHMKSLLVTVFFPAWVWTYAPEKTFLVVSYSDAAEMDNSSLCRKIVKSEWYTSRFGIILADDNDQKSSFTNTIGGYRKSFGFNGSIMGKGGDFVIVDDPHKATEVDSDAMREKVLKDYDEAVSTRLNDIKTGVRILIMQRLHTNDLTGHLLKKTETIYEHLVLPAEYDGIRFVSSIGLSDPRTQIGELLWPDKFDEKGISGLKDSLGTARAVAGQLQQRPTVEGGNIFRKEWFSIREQPNNYIARYISWDTASSVNDSSARSACVVGELLPDYRMLIRYVKAEKLEFPQLITEMGTIATMFGDKLQNIIIENKSSGISALQTIKQSSPVWISSKLKAFNPPTGMSKIGRQTLASKWCENGSIILPPPSDEVPWLFEFEKEIFSSPNGSYLDIPDALTQLILFTEHLLTAGLQARKQTPADIVANRSK